MKVIILGDDLLRRKAEAVEDIDGEIEKIAAEMIDTLHKQKGVGLAGPQVGLLKRIFVIHVEGDEPRVFINPSITATSQETVKYEEGCLSIPGVWADVVRPRAIKIQAWNVKGRPFTLETEGILARVILHEYEHLEGVRFIERLPPRRRERVLAKFDKIAAGEKAPEAG
ncbi:MAG: peptide deformylase [Treponema sp.]|jgi:peptide deformylase|nr:peptide deformylase [Treponema sp.]